MSTPTRDLSRLTLGTAPDSWGVWFAKDDKQVGWKQYPQSGQGPAADQAVFEADPL